MDLDDKRSEAMEVTQFKEEEPKKKTCVDCGTTKTPLWRGGPAGPMTLCNACGIKSRKKRGAMLGGSNKTQTKEKKSSKKATSQTTKSSSGNSNGSSKSKLGRSLDQRLIALGKEVLMRRSKTDQQRRKKLGEEEQAAVLLMALSYGYVYA